MPGPVCRMCFQNLEKLAKAQATVDTLTEEFMNYLQGRTTQLQDASAGPSGTDLPGVIIGVKIDTEIEYIACLNTTELPRKRTAAEVGPPCSASTPLRKRPLLVSQPRKTLEFTSNPGASAQLPIQGSPIVNVVSTL